MFERTFSGGRRTRTSRSRGYGFALIVAPTSTSTRSRSVTFTFEVYVRNNSLEVIQGIRGRELAYARDALQSSADEMHIGLRWWEPHTVYVLQFFSMGQYIVGVARVGSARIRSLTGRDGVLVDLECVANLWAAKVIEQQVLTIVEDAWMRPDRFSPGKSGGTERWADWLIHPRLSIVMANLEVDRTAPSWGLTVMRAGRCFEDMRPQR